MIVLNLLILISIGNYHVSADLYNSSDPVVILDSKNIYDTILNQRNGWIIEFYNSWCGHCIHYAPTWVEFSKEVKEWSHTFKVGVLDCSDDENIPICRDYEVIAYPSIRIFGASIQKGDIGTSIQKRTVVDLQESVIDFIIEKQTQKAGSPSWVNLLFYDKPIKSVFKLATPLAENAVFIVENSDSKVGAFTILDLGNYTQVYIRRVKSDSKGIPDEVQPSNFPALIFVKRDGTKELVQEGITTREELTAMIINKLKLTKMQLAGNNVIKSVGSSRTRNENEKTLGEWKKDNVGRADNYVTGVVKMEKEDLEGAGDGLPEEINVERLDYDGDLPDAAFDDIGRDRVFMVDIENTISYALRHEVVLRKVISGEELASLREFLKALTKYLPVRPPIAEFLTKLRDFVVRSGNELPVEDYEGALVSLRSHSSFLPEMRPWKRCKGSKPQYRGYPCGLWTLFHALTVNTLFMTGERNLSYDPLTTLRAVHGYVKHFFSCKHCSKHFQEMYDLDAVTSVRASSDEVLWLWQAHNKVNKRLKKDLSEDPIHPKEQFPSKKNCPSCWKKDELFDRAQVLQYLKKIYGKGSLSLEGTQEIPDEAGVMAKPFNKQVKVFKTLSQQQQLLEKEIIDSQNHQPQQRSLKREEEIFMMKKSNNSWGFNSTDLNLCVFLYVFSTIIIALGYFMFLLKRRLRRKKFIDMYKNP